MGQGWGYRSATASSPSHGGDIEAASGGPNQGSTFTVRLPHEPPAGQQEEEQRTLTRKRRFLKLSNARRERKAA